jgi:hypothetical protein
LYDIFLFFHLRVVPASGKQKGRRSFRMTANFSLIDIYLHSHHPFRAGRERKIIIGCVKVRYHYYRL